MARFPTGDHRPAGRTGLPTGSRSLAIGTLIGQVAAAIGILVAVRHFDPADFGDLGIFAALAIASGTLATLRLEAAIPIPARNSRAFSIMALAAGAVACSVGLCLLATASLGDVVLPAIGAEALVPLASLIAVGTGVVGVRSILLGWCTRTRRFRSISIARALNGFAMGGTLIDGAFRSPDLQTLVMAWIAGQAIEAMVLVISVARDRTCRPGGMTRNRRKRILKRYRRFPTVLLWGHLLDQTMNHLPTVVIAATYSTDVAGVFMVVHRLVFQPTVIMGSAVSIALVGESAKVARDGIPPGNLLDAALVRLMLLAAALFVPLAVAGPLILPAILGPGFGSAGLLLLAIIPFAASDFIALPTLPLLGFLERLGTQTLGSLIRAILVILTLSTSAAIGLGPITALALMSGTILILNASLVQAVRTAARHRDPTLIQT